MNEMLAPPETTLLYIATLRRIAEAANARMILEIGVGPDATSAAVFSTTMGGGHLVSIDIDESRPDSYQRDVIASRGATWTVVHGDSLTVEVPSTRYDLLYIDGDHANDYPLKEFERFEPMVRQGGYIVLDDYPFFEDVWNAVAVLALRGWHGLFIPYDADNANGHMIYRKPGNLPGPQTASST